MQLSETIRAIEVLPEDAQAQVVDFVKKLSARYATAAEIAASFKPDPELRAMLGTVAHGGSIDNDTIDRDLAREYEGQTT
jgi:hypothetical protein